MNGRGVFSSKKMGRLIATFEPRLVLMFAVRVLDHGEDQYDRTQNQRYDAIYERESDVRVRDLLRQK